MSGLTTHLFRSVCNGRDFRPKTLDAERCIDVCAFKYREDFVTRTRFYRRGGFPSHLVTSLLSLLSSRWSLRLSRYPKGTSSILPDGRIPGRMGKAGAPRSPPVSGGRSKCSWSARGVAGRISFYISEGAGKARGARWCVDSCEGRSLRSLHDGPRPG